MRRLIITSAALAGAALLAACGQQAETEGETSAAGAGPAAPSPPAELLSLMSLCPGGSNCPADDTVGMLLAPDVARRLGLDANPPVDPAEGGAAPAAAATSTGPATDSAASATAAGTPAAGGAQEGGTDTRGVTRQRPVACPQAGPSVCPTGRSGLIWIPARGQVNCRPGKLCMPGMTRDDLYGWLCKPSSSDPGRCDGMPGGQ